MRRLYRAAFKFVGILTTIMFMYLILPRSTLISSGQTRKTLIGNGIQIEDTGTSSTLSAPKNSWKSEIWNLLMTLTNLDRYPAILKKFEVCLSSICKHTSLALQLHIVTDERSRDHVVKSIEVLSQKLCKTKISVVYQDIAKVAEALQPLMKILQHIFTSGSRSYYNGALFFLSIITHTFFPNISKLVMLDIDLKFRTDIKQLFDKFQHFSPTNIMGLAHEQQPVYKHITWKHRRNNPWTKVEEPAPDGYPGFNSGVLLLDLDRMRDSPLYQQYMVNNMLVVELSEKYHFKGHLGDQGFYTLLGFEHPELFYVLPCTWNRQLCVWWRDNSGYQKIFHLYHNCSAPIHVHHGNCNTAILDD